MIEAYLGLLGVPRRAPSAAYLRELHRAQVTRVPYTNAEIMLGRPGTVAPGESVRRVVSGRGGYCFQLNGAFSELLRALGFTVTLHRAYVVSAPEVVDTDLNHLALLVHDLPDPANPGGRWLADAGLGDALYDPLPLVDGEHPQGPFAYTLAASPRPEAGWRLRHDPVGSFAACDIAAAPAVLDDFAGAHVHLSTSAESPFTRFLTAQRRTAAGVDILRGCTLLGIDAAGRREEHLATRERWREALAELFGLTGDDLDELWPGALAAHEEWAARRSAVAEPAA
ncbi:arylamine N-acetyltransferase family protein [Catellatospora citrea]|uniref:Arylamine N-acetyltransferase n=1 Tax=Catellatospora citrea TaxID=53366 RepID=A0A8J3P3Z0_9ACTN|nr:arylamine N-acetyltransferase [Catellatospora citrea]RKE10020.1 arylamine N-acetyltransferase [Catellatospora citrea]GIG02824.1 arylamine N-acetyltransferase [Catellatospora citrea]